VYNLIHGHSNTVRYQFSEAKFVKSLGKCLLGRPRRRWENIKMTLGSWIFEDEGWKWLAWNYLQFWSLVFAVLNLQVNLL
jgi:hypothetical protein